MNIVSFFSGAGGLDLGFTNAGFNVVWANEYDKEIWETYERNHPNTILDKRSIVNIPSDDVPDCDGIIGGPPCQSWSAAGAHKGIKDKRGQLFYDFIRILEDKQPTFFLAENVSGMLAPKHSEALKNIKQMFNDAGYNLSFKLINANNYNVGQDRKRVIFVGYNRNKTNNRIFRFREPEFPKVVLEETIYDLRNNAIPGMLKNYSNKDLCPFDNHEYMIGGFSTMYMSRNRVRGWEEQSFTIQAGGRHAPIHPQAPKMRKIEKDKHIFIQNQEELYRRLTVRECARIQTFPDDFKFYYDKISAGYKMIGNAVPVNMAEFLAQSIYNDIVLGQNNEIDLVDTFLR